MRKERCDSRLGRLTGEQQEQIWTWADRHGYVEAARRIGLPPPEGFGLKTHITSVRRFFVRYTERRDRMPMSTAELLADPHHSKLLDPATENAVHYAAFDLVHGPVDLKAFSKVSNWLLAQKNIELREQQIELGNRQLELAREKFVFDREQAELNAAELALKYFGELRLIVANSDTGHDAKVRAARQLLFAPRHENS